MCGGKGLAAIQNDALSPHSSSQTPNLPFPLLDTSPPSCLPPPRSTGSAPSGSGTLSPSAAPSGTTFWTAPPSPPVSKWWHTHTCFTLYPPWIPHACTSVSEQTAGGTPLDPAHSLNLWFSTHAHSHAHTKWWPSECPTSSPLLPFNPLPLLCLHLIAGPSSVRANYKTCLTSWDITVNLGPAPPSPPLPIQSVASPPPPSPSPPIGNGLDAQLLDQFSNVLQVWEWNRGVRGLWMCAKAMWQLDWGFRVELATT